MRFRSILLGLGSITVLTALFATDPDLNLIDSTAMSATVALLVGLSAKLIAVAAAHISRKGLFDYLDMQEYADNAKQSPTGSGLVFLGVCLVIYGLLGLFGGMAQAATVPKAAHQYLPTLSVEIDRQWPNVPSREYFGGLIDHESACPRVSQCWQPTARLKSQREEGAGFPQLTRAWTTSGALRFDALTELADRHPALRELNWNNVYQRPDLQLRAIVLKVRGDFSALAPVVDRMERMRFADAAYNGGLGGVNRERRECGLKAGCNPQKWNGHVELIRVKSQQPIYGTRSPWDINRHHVRDVIDVRAPRYKGMV